MKTHHSFAPALLSLVALAVAPAISATGTQPSLMHPVDLVNINGMTVTVGTPEAKVLQVLGQPARKRLGDPSGKLDENVWVYPAMEGRTIDHRSQQDDCHILLVTMTDTGGGRGWRVSEMKLVNSVAQQFYIAQIAAKTAETLVAVK